MKPDDYTLRKPVRVESEYKERSCKGSFGRVAISASPSQGFSFRSIASWPDANYESAIQRGILEALTSAGYDSTFNAAFVLEQIDWHEVESTEYGYFIAARQATEKILASGLVQR